MRAHLCPQGRRSRSPLIAFCGRQFGAILLGFLATTAQAENVPQEIASALQSAAQRGSAQVRWLGIPIYSARLFTQDARRFDWASPFALELTYNRGFDQDRLVYATGKELTRMEGKQADHSAILTKLQTCYRDVSNNDRFVAFGKARDEVLFSLNGNRTCLLKHPDIRKRLLSIWVSEKSRDPKLSRRLTGQ